MDAAEAKVTSAGDEVRAVKAAKGDIKPALEALTAAKAELVALLTAALASEGDAGKKAEYEAKIAANTPKSRSDKKKDAKKNKGKAPAAKPAAAAGGAAAGAGGLSKKQQKKAAAAAMLSRHKQIQNVFDRTYFSFKHTILAF